VKLEGRQLPPKNTENLPQNSKWLSGDGGGAWFHISDCNKWKASEFNIKRFTPEGVLDCDRMFVLQENKVVFEIEKPFEYIHISHCAKCRILQNGVVFIFEWVG